MSNERVSLEELKEIANQVRLAGGGNPIDALMPSVPEEPTMCLIARNMNFNCSVNGLDNRAKGLFPDLDLSDVWEMRVSTREIARKISDSLGWPMYDTFDIIPSYRRYERDRNENRWVVVLPAKVGRVAADFDRASGLTHEFQELVEMDACETGGDAMNPSGRCLKRVRKLFIEHYGRNSWRLLREMLPYIESAEEEAYSLASLIHPDGSISI